MNTIKFIIILLLFLLNSISYAEQPTPPPIECKNLSAVIEFQHVTENLIRCHDREGGAVCWMNQYGIYCMPEAWTPLYIIDYPQQEPPSVDCSECSCPECPN